jgi:hypothetical protein
MLIYALIRTFLYLYPTSHPAGGVKILQKAGDLISDDLKVVFRIAESNLHVLNTVDLGPNRPFSVGGCALRAWLTGLQFAAQVAAVVSLVEAPANHRKATTVAKEIMAIKYGNTTGRSVKKFLESPFAGKHPKLISKGTKAAADEAAVTAAEAIAVADLEEANRLATEFEALGGGAHPWRSLRRPNPGDSGSHTSCSACRRTARSIARKS